MKSTPGPDRIECARVHPSADPPAAGQRGRAAAAPDQPLLPAIVRVLRRRLPGA
jgi:hypothetical protein